MAEGLTVAQEAFRLGMIGSSDPPYWYGSRPDDTAAAYFAGLFVRWLAGLDVHPELEDDEMIEWDPDAPLGACMCDYPESCGGSGALQCDGCGGDLCICVCGGEIDCHGCEDCDDQSEDDAP